MIFNYQKMIDGKACMRRTLATGEFTVIERCSCGSIHVTIGAITLRLASSAIRPLAAAFGEAARALALHDATALAPSREEVVS